MKEFLNQNKIFLYIVITTVILVIGAVFLFSKSSTSTQLNQKVQMSLLIPQTATKTSGIINGNYLAASPSATISLVEFGDYECPACGTYHPFVKQLLTSFAGKITYIFRNYPLPQHANAQISSEAVEAAGLQGKYWQMHDKIFETQNNWSSVSDPTDIFVSFAKDMGLDINKFKSDLTSQKIINIIQSDKNDGDKVGLTQTPTFFLNGQVISLTGSSEQLKSLVQSLLNK